MLILSIIRKLDYFKIIDDFTLFTQSNYAIIVRTISLVSREDKCIRL